jgi:hypothetical protein
MPMPRMSSGIRACCRLVMRAARHRSHRHPGSATDMHVAATRLLEIWRRFVVAHIFISDA